MELGAPFRIRESVTVDTTGAVGERCGSPSLDIAGVRLDRAPRGALPKVAAVDFEFPSLFLSGAWDA